MSASSTLVSIWMRARSCAIWNSSGACICAATVCPTSTLRATTTPSTGERISVRDRSMRVWSRLARTFTAWARALLRFAWAIFTLFCACSKALRAFSRSLVETRPSSASICARSKSRRAWSSDTCALLSCTSCEPIVACCTTRSASADCTRLR
jgi:hypothetical protein